MGVKVKKKIEDDKLFIKWTDIEYITNIENPLESLSIYLENEYRMFLLGVGYIADYDQFVFEIVKSSDIILARGTISEEFVEIWFNNLLLPPLNDWFNVNSKITVSPVWRPNDY